MRTHLSVKAAILFIGSTATFSATATAEERTAQVTMQEPSPAVVQSAPMPQEVERETVSEKGGPSPGMLTSGLVVFGVSYGAAAITGAVSNADGDRDLFVPFAGPWMALDNHGGAGTKVLLVTDGVFQGVGALLVLGAFLNPQERTVTRTHAAEVRIVPAVGPALLGLSATGQF